jgi:sortase (surface protein transpeptidase)
LHLNRVASTRSPVHRDTHFRFLKDVAIGDEIVITRSDGKVFHYRADGSSVARFDVPDIDPLSNGYALVLSTCWPFDAAMPEPMRHLLHAALIEDSAALPMSIGNEIRRTLPSMRCVAGGNGPN